MDQRKHPSGTKAGKYTGTVTVKADGITLSELKLNLQVKNRTLPPPSEWTFHLDLWQNPYAVSRYYNVEPFSKNISIDAPIDETVCRCRW